MVLTWLVLLGALPLSTSQLDRMLSWLPADTETVVVDNREGSTAAMEGAGTLAQQLSFAALVGIDNDTALPKSFAYSYLIEGFRKIRVPAELGLWPYEGCKLVGLSPQEYTKLQEFVKKKWRPGGSSEGVEIYKLSERLEQDTWSFCAAFDQGRMYYATDKSYLLEVLARSHGRSGARALPDALPQWKYIDKSAPFWAVRRFTPAALKLPYDADMGDKQLHGYAMWMDKDVKSFHAVSLSNNPHGYDIAKVLWEKSLAAWGTTSTSKNKGAAAFKVTRIDGRTAELSVNASVGDGSPASFLILFCLGHCINL